MRRASFARTCCSGWICSGSNLPALRERGEDILKLAGHLLGQLCRNHRLPLRQITEEGKRRLLAYRWPGNVRELAHELERGLVFEPSAALDFAHLPGDAAPSSAAPATGNDWLNPGFKFPEQGFVLEDAMNRLVQLALKQADGNVSHAARMLGVTRDFVRYRLHGDRKEKVSLERNRDGTLKAAELILRDAV